MASHGARFQREKVEDSYNFIWQANSHFNLSSVPDRSKKIEFEKVSTCPVIEEQTSRWFNTNNTPRPKNGSCCSWRLMKIQVWESHCTTLRLCSQGAQLKSPITRHFLSPWFRLSKFELRVTCVLFLLLCAWNIFGSNHMISSAIGGNNGN